VGTVWNFTAGGHTGHGDGRVKDDIGALTTKIAPGFRRLRRARLRPPDTFTTAGPSTSTATREFRRRATSTLSIPLNLNTRVDETTQVDTLN